MYKHNLWNKKSFPCNNERFQMTAIFNVSELLLFFIKNIFSVMSKSIVFVFSISSIMLPDYMVCVVKVEQIIISVKK